MATPGDYDVKRQASAEGLGTHVVIVTASNTDLPASAKGVTFDADGTITVERRGGGDIVAGVPVIKGLPLIFVPGRVTAMSGPTKCFVAIN